MNPFQFRCRHTATEQSYYWDSWYNRSPLANFSFLNLLTIDFVCNNLLPLLYSISKTVNIMTSPAFSPLFIMIYRCFYFTLTHTVLSSSHCNNIILKDVIWTSSKMLFNNGQLLFSFLFTFSPVACLKIMFSFLNCPFQNSQEYVFSELTIKM